MKNIAYFAPEIPSLSATFVYNEILDFDKLISEFKIFPFSIHVPKSIDATKEVKELQEKTYYIYPISLLKLFISLVFIHFQSIKKCLRVYKLFFSLILIEFHFIQGLKLFWHALIGISISPILRVNNIAHIHVHFAHFPLQIAMFAGEFLELPYSFTAHANDIFVNGYWLKEKVNRSKFTVTISHFNKRYLIDKNCNHNKIHIVRCTAHMNKINEDKQKKSIHLQLKAKFIIGSLGRMIPKKGIDTLIHSAKYLEDSNINFEIQLAGNGPELEKYKEMVIQLKLSEKIHFIGNITHDMVNEWMNGLDIFVLACRKDSSGDMDGIPVVLMEAMSLKVPVISTYLSGIPELIENNISGLLVEPEQAEELGNAIKEIIKNPKSRIVYSESAFKKIKDEFSTELNLKRLHDLLLS